MKPVENVWRSRSILAVCLCALAVNERIPEPWLISSLGKHLSNEIQQETVDWKCKLQTYFECGISFTKGLSEKQKPEAFFGQVMCQRFKEIDHWRINKVTDFWAIYQTHALPAFHHQERRGRTPTQVRSLVSEISFILITVPTLSTFFFHLAIIYPSLSHTKFQ